MVLIMSGGFFFLFRIRVGSVSLGGRAGSLGVAIEGDEGREETNGQEFDNE